MEKTKSTPILSSIIYLILLLFFIIEANCFHSVKDLIPTHFNTSHPDRSAHTIEQSGDDMLDEQIDFQYVSVFDQIITQQDQYRKMINFQYSHFKSYFTCLKDQDQSVRSSDFYLSYPLEQQIKGQVHVFWKDESNNQFKPQIPQYNLGQYASLTIQSFNELTNSTAIIHHKTFYVQSAFSFLAVPNLKYKLKFSNFGTESKLISFFVSNVQPFKSIINFVHSNSTIGSVQMRGESLYSELEAILNRKQYYDMSKESTGNKIWENVVKYYYCDMFSALLIILLMALQARVIFPGQKREQSII